MLYSNTVHQKKKERKKKKRLLLSGLEPGTFRMQSERDNHYTTELC